MGNVGCSGVKQLQIWTFYFEMSRFRSVTWMTLSLRLSSLILGWIGGKFDDDFRKLVGGSSRCSECSCKNWLPVAVWLTANSAHLIQTSPGWLQVHVFHRWAQQQTIKGTKPRNIYKINGWTHPWRIILTSASHPPQKKKHSSRPSNNWPYHTSGLKHTNLEIPSEHAATRPPGHINPSSTPLVFLGTCRPPAPRGYYCVSMLVRV